MGVVAALAALRAAGIPVVAITGRPIGWSLPVAADVPLAAVVAENGSVALIPEGEGAVRTEYADSAPVEAEVRSIENAYLVDKPVDEEQLEWLLRGIEAMQQGRLEEADGVFTRLIDAAPDFAEGWNKRATLYFLIGDYRKSLFDCDRVIERNPQHFGVLAGYAQIHARLGAYDRALDYARRALDLNPNLSGVRESIEVLERLDAERRRRTT